MRGLPTRSLLTLRKTLCLLSITTPTSLSRTVGITLYGDAILDANLDAHSSIHLSKVTSSEDLRPRLLEPALANHCYSVLNPFLAPFPLFSTVPKASRPMSGMARQESAGTFTGFAVYQPALGAPLQWLPAIGTPELDQMIHALIPGTASIQDKRAQVSMDFLEYAHQTGEKFKFYPVRPASCTPVTGSPASSSTPFDATSSQSSSVNASPVVTQGAWAQSPAAVTPADIQPRPRPAVTKRSSTSSSRQQAMDFFNHPGMRILTKDGRDVTNMASRGCKTKEQREHAHLMRIIKACDTCRRKKVRCDPSHKKRNASQASPSQHEQKPAKKVKKIEESPPVAFAGESGEFVGSTASDAAALTADFQTLEAQDIEKFWEDFIMFDQEPSLLAANQFTSFDFDFDSFIGLQSCSSSSSSSASPSQGFASSLQASPATVSDPVVDVAADASLFSDSTIPYLNPLAALGTDYTDFNLYSPGPDNVDEDPVFQMTEVASRQQQFPLSSPRSSVAHAATTSTPQFSFPFIPAESSRSAVSVSRTSPVDNPRMSYYSSFPDYTGQFSHSPDEPAVCTNQQYESRRSETIYRPTNHKSHAALELSGDVTAEGATHNQSTTKRQQYGSSSSTTAVSSANTVAASIVQSSLSPSPSPRPSGLLRAPAAISSPASFPRAIKSAHGADAVGQGLCGPTGVIENRSVTTNRTTVPRIVTAVDVHSTVMTYAGVLKATTATTSATTASTFPTRRIVAGQENAANEKSVPQRLSFSPPGLFFQLVVFGLVSLLCAAAVLLPQAPLTPVPASLANLILAFTSISSSLSQSAGPQKNLPTYVDCATARICSTDSSQRRRTKRSGFSSLLSSARLLVLY